MRAKSLIITFFGDVVSQHGQSIWLGSISEALEPLGVNDRLVRTSVFRLVKEGWLDVDRIGRRSFYGFTDYGSLEYQRAAKRIYAIDSDTWRGGWQVLFLIDVPDRQREDLRRSLHWLGFRALASGAYARPGGDDNAIAGVLDEFNLENNVIVMNAHDSALTHKKLLRDTVRDQWALDALAEDYTVLISRYRGLRQALDKGKLPSNEEAFQARLLLIHDYRRILLRDTPLPEDLLPSRWPGTTARQLAASLYRELATPSIAFIREKLESQQGQLGNPIGAFNTRFERV